MEKTINDIINKNKNKPNFLRLVITLFSENKLLINIAITPRINSQALVMGL